MNTILVSFLFIYSVNGVDIRLSNEACAIKDAPKNLTYRAHWSSKEGVYEGCFSLQGPIVTMYFKDHTSVALPAAVFKPIQGL